MQPAGCLSRGVLTQTVTKEVGINTSLLATQHVNLQGTVSWCWRGGTGRAAGSTAPPPLCLIRTSTWVPCVSRPAGSCVSNAPLDASDGLLLLLCCCTACDARFAARAPPHPPAALQSNPCLHAGIHDGIAGRNPLYDLVLKLGLKVSPRQDYGSSALGELRRREASASWLVKQTLLPQLKLAWSLQNCTAASPTRSRHLLLHRPAHQPLPVWPHVLQLVQPAAAGAGAPQGRTARR